MKTYDKNTVLDNPKLLTDELILKVKGIPINYIIHHGNDGRVKGLFKLNSQIIHGVNITSTDISRDMNTIEEKILKKIYSAEICQYCGKETRFDNIHHEYHCDPCGAKIGCHKESLYKSLGSLANIELAKLRKAVHYYFDKLWNYSYERGIIEKPERGVDHEIARNWKTKCRISAYKWLAIKLDIVDEYCHIGMFDDEQCEEALGVVIGYSEELDIYYDEIRNMIINKEITFKKYSYDLDKY